MKEVWKAGIGIVGFSFMAVITPIGNSIAAEYNLTVDRIKIDTGEFSRSGIGFNGASPGPIHRIKKI